MVTGENFAQHNRQGPAVNHDVVIGQHNAVLVRRGPDQCHSKCRRVGQVAHRGSFGGAHPPHLLFDIRVAVQLHIPPTGLGIGRDDLHRLVELATKACRQIGMPADHHVDRIAQPVWVKGPGHRQVQLDRIHVVAGECGAGVKEQAPLHRGQRQHVGNAVLPL